MPRRSALLVAASAGILTSSAAGAAQANTLTRAGDRLTGIRVATHCATPAEDRALRVDWALAETIGTRIVLSRPVCQFIATDSRERAFAVEVYAHELGHASLHTKVECLAQRYGVAHWRALWTLLIPSAPTSSQVRYLAQRNFVYPWKTCGSEAPA